MKPPQGKPVRRLNSPRAAASQMPTAKSCKRKPDTAPNCARSLRQARGRLAEDAEVQKLLRAISTALESNTADREDVFQEAMLHLWQAEHRCPGQRLSWYLQSCAFHLQHLRRTGRSVDSASRGWRRVELDGAGVEDTAAVSGGCVASEVCARDLRAALDRMLEPSQKAVLDLLIQGCGARDIAVALRISVHEVLTLRRNIGRQARQLQL
jgi:DNA-directed RNA polymerase specialized sigma24 family protein